MASSKLSKRDLTRGGYKEQVRGYCREAHNLQASYWFCSTDRHLRDRRCRTPLHFHRMPRVVAIHRKGGDEDRAVDADLVHRPNHLITRNVIGPVRDTVPWSLWSVRLIGVDLGVDDRHRKSPHRSPQPQRPTNQVGCDTERTHDDCDFKQAFDWVHGRAIGRHGAIAALAAINSRFRHRSTGCYSFYVAPRSKAPRHV